MKTIHTIIEQVRAEFTSTPHVQLSADQVHHRCGVDIATAEMVLEFLTDTQFLRRTSTYDRPLPEDQRPTCS
jgi:response regulator of citrate/malate metabolism